MGAVKISQAHINILRFVEYIVLFFENFAQRFRKSRFIEDLYKAIGNIDI